jgi:hypothetical protein
MRILVLGDSFAEHVEGWPSTLERLLGPTAKITVRAQGGTGIYYAYRRLIEQKIDYDFYIVLVSGYQRLFVNDDLSSNGNYRLNATENQLTALKYYFEHLYSDDYHRLTHRLILDEINRLLGDKPKLFIPCFNKDVSLLDHPFCLADWESRESDLIGVKMNKLAASRRNHFLPINNDLLAIYFRDMILYGESKLTVKDVRPPPQGN